MKHLDRCVCGAILDWAEKSGFFRSPDEAAAALLTLREDGSASLKITVQP